MKDRLIRLLATETLNLDDLNNIPNDSIDIKILRKKFISTFIGIYEALWHGQTSFFKSANWVHEYRLSTLRYKNAMELIFQHAGNPGSRSEKALALMKNYSHFHTTNKELMKEIYLYSFFKSGFLKRSSRIDRLGYFFRDSSVKQANAIHRFQGVSGLDNTRRDKIFKAMEQIPTDVEIRSSIRSNR